MEEKKIPYYTIVAKAKKFERILGRAIVDPNFRKTLFECPADVAKEYEMDEESLAAIKQIDRSSIEKLAKSLETRITKDAAVIIFCGSA